MVGGGEQQTGHVLTIKPGEPMDFDGLGITVEAGTPIDHHQQVKRFVGVGYEIPGFGIQEGNVQLLFEFPNQGRFGRFSRQELAARKFPMQGKTIAGSALAEQGPTGGVLDQGGGDDDNCNGLRHGKNFPSQPPRLFSTFTWHVD